MSANFSFNVFSGLVYFNRVTIFEGQCPNGACCNAFSTSIAPGLGYRVVGKCGYHSLETPLGKTNSSYSQALMAYPYAPAAEHTLVGVIDEDRAAVIHWQVSL